MKRPYYAYPFRFLSLVLCGVVLLLSLAYASGLGPGPATRPPAWDVQRALSNARAWAVQPHPRGSAAQEEVRAGLLAALQEAGLRPVEMRYTVSAQDAFQFAGDETLYPDTPLSNILVELPGTGSDVVLVTAPYDSAPTSPGAMDLLASALMTEYLATLQGEGAAFSNTLVFLFTEGTSQGHLGAHCFAESRRPEAALVDGEPLPQAEWQRLQNLSQRVKFVLALDSIGTAGPVVLLESTAGNGVSLAEFAAVNPGLTASSLTSLVYRTLGRSSGFTPFAQRNIQGLHFAAIGEAYFEGTQGDDGDRLRPETAYALGNALEASVRRFGRLPLDALALTKADAVLFDYLGLSTFVLPRSAGWIAAGVLFLLLLIWFLRARRRQSAGLVLRNLVLGFLVVILGCFAGCLAAYGLSFLLSANSASFAARLASARYASLPLYLGLGAGALAVALLVWGGLAKLFALEGRRLREATVFLLSLLGVICAFVLPQAAYLFLPAGLIGAALMLLTTLRTDEEPPPLGLYSLVFAAFAPFAIALGLIGMDLLGARGILFLLLPLLLCFALVLPYALDIPTRRRVLSWLSACLVCLLVSPVFLALEAIQSPAQDPSADFGDHPASYRALWDDDTLQYVVDIDIRRGTPILRDGDLVRALDRSLGALGYGRSGEGWAPRDFGGEVISPGIREPAITARYNAITGRTTLEIRRAYPDGIFELDFPAVGVTAVTVERGEETSQLLINPLAGTAPTRRVFQAGEDCIVTLAASHKIEEILYTEYLPDAGELLDTPTVESVLRLSPRVRPQLRLVKRVEVGDL